MKQFSLFFATLVSLIVAGSNKMGVQPNHSNFINAGVCACVCARARARGVVLGYSLLIML